jgi:acyl-coenzyme A thioesterase PaaI-like protein
MNNEIMADAAGGALTTQARPKCFVCGPQNAKGLQLRFEMGADGEAIARWKPDSAFEGAEGIIHGGIVSTVLDEAMSKAIAARGWKAFTCELRVRLRRHVTTGGTFTIRGWVVEKRKRRVLAEALLAGPEGDEYAHAWASFLEPPGDGS